MSMTTKLDRRRLLLSSAALLPLAGLPVGEAFAAQTRRLSFYHCHTGEKLKVTYHEQGQYLEDGLGEINTLLRDFRSGESWEMDRALLDMLHALQEQTGGTTFEIISAYRSPATNAMLRNKSNGVAKRSLHMRGMAIDVRLQGVATRDLREAALALKAGGVGYYPKSDFVHLDTGRVRFW